MRRLKDDEIELLHAIQLGAAGSVSLASDRRSALMRRFERNGWVSEGKITRHGEKQLTIQAKLYPPSPLKNYEESIALVNDLQSSGAIATSEVNTAVVVAAEELNDSEERQDDDGNIQGQDREGMDD